MRNDSRLLPTAQRTQRASPPFFSAPGCVVRYEEIGWSGAGVDGPRNLYGQVTFFPSGVCASLRGRAGSAGLQTGCHAGLQARALLAISITGSVGSPEPMHKTKVALAPGLSYMRRDAPGAHPSRTLRYRGPQRQVFVVGVIEGWDTTNPMREAPPPGQPALSVVEGASPLQIISPFRRTMILRSLPSNHRPVRPLRAAFQPEAAGRGRNSA
jgi:hypothetical protein